jgi:hypothetical protein
MGMSKKDYVAAADLIASANKWATLHETPTRRKAKIETLLEVMDGLASMFAQDNGRFDRDMFATACGFGTVPSDTRKLSKGDTLYYFGKRVKVVGTKPGKIVTITKLYQGRHYGEPFDVKLSHLNY